MAKSRKVGIIGHFGGKETFLDGQTVKTKILHTELQNATDWNIRVVDTYYRSKNPVKLLWDTLACLCSCKDVFILLSGNGMRLYFPLMSLWARLFGTRVYHDVIGGNLAGYVDKYPKYRNYLNAFRVNWVETGVMKGNLEARGITNAEVMPNFKRLNVVMPEQLQPIGEVARFCTFSRVMKEKGIEDAANAVESINAKAGKTVCTLDIYGRIDDSYTAQFQKLLDNATEAVKYCGMVPFDKSVEAISKYDALLFPTYWDGEGFAGTIVDAFSAGLPVIATDWNCNGEIVAHKVDGILYPSDGIADLEAAIHWLLQDPNRAAEMKKACICSAQKYQPDAYIEKMVAFIEGR